MFTPAQLLIRLITIIFKSRSAVMRCYTQCHTFIIASNSAPSAAANTCLKVFIDLSLDKDNCLRYTTCSGASNIRSKSSTCGVHAFVQSMNYFTQWLNFTLERHPPFCHIMLHFQDYRREWALQQKTAPVPYENEVSF